MRRPATREMTICHVMLPAGFVLPHIVLIGKLYERKHPRHPISDIQGAFPPIPLAHGLVPAATPAAVDSLSG
jgi:hypothetical protein